jgi:hypothetical protein
MTEDLKFLIPMALFGVASLVLGGLAMSMILREDFDGEVAVRTKEDRIDGYLIGPGINISADFSMSLDALIPGTIMGTTTSDEEESIPTALSMLKEEAGFLTSQGKCVPLGANGEAFLSGANGNVHWGPLSDHPVVPTVVFDHNHVSGATEWFSPLGSGPNQMIITGSEIDDTQDFPWWSFRIVAPDVTVPTAISNIARMTLDLKPYMPPGYQRTLNEPEASRGTVQSSGAYIRAEDKLSYQMAAHVGDGSFPGAVNLLRCATSLYGLRLGSGDVYSLIIQGVIALQLEA